MYCVITNQTPDAVNVMADTTSLEVFGPFESEALAFHWVERKEKEWPHVHFLVLEARVPRSYVERAAEAMPKTPERVVELSGSGRLRRGFRDQIRREVASTSYDESFVRRVYRGLTNDIGEDPRVEDVFDLQTKDYAGSAVLVADVQILAQVPAPPAGEGPSRSQEVAWCIAHAGRAIRSMANLLCGPDWPPPEIKRQLLA